MAERDYMRGEGVTPIQEMSTRQLRRYVRERAEEARYRVDTLSDDAWLPRAFQEQLEYVESFGRGRSGGIKKDTSRMSKVEMVEYAYALRDLNILDTESKYAKDTDYKENKERYQSFVRNQLNSLNPESREYWSQFLTPKGNISKRGYQEYKNFINFIKNIDESMTTYGYETIKDIYYDQSDKKKKDEVEQLLIRTYEENKGKGLTPSQLIDDFYDRLNEQRAQQRKPKTKAKPKKAATPSVKAKKGKAPKSGNNIQTKGVKMRNGAVREKQGTKKL